MAGLVKHFQSSMQGIPQLSNNWGRMITLLDAVLVTGFNFRTITSISKSAPNAITATIQLGSGHGFIDRQVIRIAGSTNGWDGDFKVLSANSNDILIECLSTNPASIEGTASCSTAPLDFEVVYSTPVGSIEPKRAYRSKDPESLGLILLVHDFCVAGAAATGAKFAKVGVVSNMTDIDSITGAQMPFNPAQPNLNWGWDGTYHGWAKWYYKLPNYTAQSHTAPDNQAPNSTSADFNIVGDSESFIIETKASNLNSYTVGGFFCFDDFQLKSKNMALMAAGINTPRTQNSGFYYHTRGGYLKALGPTAYAAFNVSAKLWFNTEALLDSIDCTKNLNISADSVDKNVLIDSMVFDSNNLPRGVIPFLKNSISQINETVFLQDTGKTIKRYESYSSSVLQYALTLESL
ncbi:hypothetical protein MJ004_13070 [Acinetobacter junii]|uniref:hypothetical protein n=1 Tax=Acinetobacter junii TaxID=40215 RepID=UPI0022EA7D14|nr:hypothetical protein [Acinetobacter junii]MDA3509323.1 hypothetical protein [Acinetobacter junii]MDA3533622.1 hypothetical protein [Acinetobacter junii]